MILGKGKVTITIEAEVEFSLENSGGEMEFTSVDPVAQSSCDINFTSPVGTTTEGFQKINDAAVHAVLTVISKLQSEKLTERNIKQGTSIITSLQPKGPVH